jgi:acyl carrier protein
LARATNEGELIYLGRIDHQVKIRGYRIELDEISNRLQEHSNVSQAFIRVQGSGGDAYLVAYYVAVESISTTDLRYYLENYLPDYMVPNIYIHMESFPLTNNGKIDRRALPEPKLGVNLEYVAPSTDLENQLVQVWSMVLKTDTSAIGITNSFFELGGHSLSAISLKYQVLKSIGFDLSIRDIFMNPTIQTLAEFIDNSTWLSDENFNQNEEDGDEDDYMEITI